MVVVFQVFRFRVGDESDALNSVYRSVLAVMYSEHVETETPRYLEAMEQLQENLEEYDKLQSLTSQ